MRTAAFRFYGELSDFLPDSTITRRFELPASVKDMIEAVGVPHPEVDLVLANGNPVGWDYLVRDQDRVAAYPRFRSLDVSKDSPVHVAPPSQVRFVLDAHLGRLARYLRLIGLDALHHNDYDDEQLAQIAARHHRVLLTRDLELLKRNAVRRGRYVRAIRPLDQAIEVVDRFDLIDHLEPFSRCMACNGKLRPADRDAVADLVPERARGHSDYTACSGCGRVYWKGSHYRRLEALVAEIRASADRYE